MKTLVKLAVLGGVLIGLGSVANAETNHTCANPIYANLPACQGGK